AVYLRLLAQQTDDAGWRNRFAHLFWELPKEVRGQTDSHNVRIFGMSQWFDLPAAKGSSEAALENVPRGVGSDLLGARGIGILRSGQKENRRAVFMRGGVNNVHGHDD